MYLAVVAPSMFTLPIASIIVDPAVPFLLLVGKWFVFWSVGVRLTLAGCGRSPSPLLGNWSAK